MKFQQGNQWWRQRAKHGRDVLFTTPEILWEACCEYFEKTDQRKWVKKDWVGKDATPVERECETPYTKSGLFLHLDCNEQYFNTFKKTIASGNVERACDFLTIISRVEQIIYTQKIEGANVGAFNASIVARELNLKESTDITSGGEKIQTPAPVINVYNTGPPLADKEDSIDSKDK